MEAAFLVLVGLALGAVSFKGLRRFLDVRRRLPAPLERVRALFPLRVEDPVLDAVAATLGLTRAGTEVTGAVDGVRVRCVARDIEQYDVEVDALRGAVTIESRQPWAIDAYLAREASAPDDDAGATTARQFASRLKTIGPRAQQLVMLGPEARVAWVALFSTTGSKLRLRDGMLTFSPSASEDVPCAIRFAVDAVRAMGDGRVSSQSIARRFEAEPDPAVRDALAEAMLDAFGATAEAEAVASAIIDATEHPAVEARAAKRLRDPDRAAAAARRWHDSAKEIDDRALAALFLEALGQPVEDDLIALLTQSEKFDREIEIIRTLARVGTVRSVAALEARARRPRLNGTRVAARQAIDVIHERLGVESSSGALALVDVQGGQLSPAREDGALAEVDDDV